MLGTPGFEEALDDLLGDDVGVKRAGRPPPRNGSAWSVQRTRALHRRRVGAPHRRRIGSPLGRRALRGHTIQVSQIGGQVVPYVCVRAPQHDRRPAAVPELLLQIGIPNRRDAQPRRLLVVLRHGPTLSCKPLKSRLKLRRELPLSFAILQWPLRQGVRRGRAHAVAHDGLHELGHPACEGLVGDEFVGKEAASHDGIDVFAHV